MDRCPAGTSATVLPEAFLIPHLRTWAVDRTQSHGQELHSAQVPKDSATAQFAVMGSTGPSLAPAGTPAPPLNGGPLGWFPRLGMLFELSAGLPGGISLCGFFLASSDFPWASEACGEVPCDSSM